MVPMPHYSAFTRQRALVSVSREEPRRLRHPIVAVAVMSTVPPEPASPTKKAPHKGAFFLAPTAACHTVALARLR
jgi:hypothetical protein